MMKKTCNRRGKRLAAILLSVTLVGTLLPVTAHALELEPENKPDDESVVVCAEGCLGAECTLEDCQCACHPVEPEDEYDSEIVTVVPGDPAPVNPVAPVDPEQPVVPVEPAPVDPEQPVVPVEPAPVDPEEPVVPMEPVVPAEPEEPETVEEPDEIVEDTPVPMTLTWLNQNGDVIHTAEKMTGDVLTEEDFPELEQVGWYLVGEDGVMITTTPAKVGDVLDGTKSFRAVDRWVKVEMTTDTETVDVGTVVTFTATVGGFEGTPFAIQWQNCPLNEDGSLTNTWTPVEGEAMTYEFTLTEENWNLAWRAVVNVI